MHMIAIDFRYFLVSVSRSYFAQMHHHMHGDPPALKGNQNLARTRVWDSAVINFMFRAFSSRLYSVGTMVSRLN